MVSSLAKRKLYLWSFELPVSFEEEVGKDRFFFFSSLFSSEASTLKRKKKQAQILKSSELFFLSHNPACTEQCLKTTDLA